MRIANKKQFIVFCLIILSIFGFLSFWLILKIQKEAGRPENQVRAYLHSIQKKTPDFFTDNPKNIETPEILKLKENNPQIAETFAQNRIQDISDLKQKITGKIQRNWLRMAKTAEDKERIRQIKFLKKITTQAYKKEKQSEGILATLSELKNSNNFHTYYNEEQKTSREVLPSLIYAENKLTTAETPYEISLPQKDSPEIKFNQKDNKKETQITLTLKNAATGNPKVYDNRALYSEIKKGVDQMLATEADGLNNHFIIKNPLGLVAEDGKGILNFDYNLIAGELTVTEDQGAIILADKNGVKKYVITPPALADTDKKAPGEIKFNLTKNTEGNYQLQVEVKINKEASFPLLVNFNLLPALTRYVEKTEGQALAAEVKSADYLSATLGTTLPEEAKKLIADIGNGEKITAQTSTDSFMSKLELPEEEKDALSPTPSQRERGVKEKNPRFNLEENKKKDALQELAVKTVFDSLDDQVRQTITFKNGNNTASFRVNLENSAGYRQEIYQGGESDTKVYIGKDDLIAYTQNAMGEKGEMGIKGEIGERGLKGERGGNEGNGNEGKIELKEIIYATNPNQTNGHSRYVWDFSEVNDNSKITLEKKDDGSINVFEELQIVGIDPNDKDKQQRAIDVVKQALSNSQIRGRIQIASIQPIIYITQDGKKRTADYNVSENKISVDIEEKKSAYPLLIDPTMEWLQWMGGITAAEDIVLAIAVNNDEIYAGGISSSDVSFSSATYTGGTFSKYMEVFVVEMTDNGSAAPTLNWLQWLGGDEFGEEFLFTLAVNGDEIYAGGYTDNDTNWESATYTGGSFSGSSEGWVVEMTDNASAAPTLNWLQWLGGDTGTALSSLAVNGDEVYAGGYTFSSADWESFTYTGGSFSSYSEGWVVEMTDNASAAPTLNWFQWLGGDNYNDLVSIAVNGDEIYAGGVSSIDTNWESATYTGGSYSGSSEGWVVEMADNASAAPTLNWFQWLGGESYDFFSTLAVNGDEIYASGFSYGATGWESATYTGGSFSGYIECFVVEMQDNSSAAPTLNWLQWLGSGENYNSLYTLAVNGDEIYAIGFTSSANDWESFTYTGGTYSGVSEEWVSEMTDNASAAPTLNWLQWLGGSEYDEEDTGIVALVVSGDEIYAGGATGDDTDWESATYTGGSFSGYTEGLVVELADNASAAPTLNWFQWLGGVGGAPTDINAIAVNGDEIYAGGNTSAEDSFPSATYTGGTISGYQEGFVVEMQDNASAAPTLNWLQWLGGSSSDYIFDLVVNGDEIYAGGATHDDNEWESTTYTGGTFSEGENEGYVVEMTDNASAAPTLNWLQWLGGPGDMVGYGQTSVNALVVNGDEIYAGGSSDYSADWESATYTGGSFSGYSEGWVVEMTDNASAAPTLNWFQWLGGEAFDTLSTLAINGDEIYAGGSSDYSTSWESATYTGGSYSSTPEGWVVEMTDNASAAPTLNWLQWLGGANDDNVNVLAVNGDEIYAGGVTGDDTNWESATYTGGSYSGSSEGWVVEMTDNASAAPTLNWLQWLGGSSSDYLLDLVVNGDEIYAGGNTTLNTGWETAFYTNGAFGSDQEGWVMELGDNESAAPRLNWLQWLEGAGEDNVNVLAVSGDEIYAGGSSDYVSGWGAVKFIGGTHISISDTILIEIMDIMPIPATMRGNVTVRGEARVR